MNAKPYAIMLCGPPPAAESAKSGPKSTSAETEDSFSDCMPWVADYDEEWMACIEQHAMKKYWAHAEECETEVLPRVWNMPHS